MRETDRRSDDALANAWSIQADASALGFDWPDASGVLDKIAEELNEIREALEAGTPAEAQRELGDLFLAAVNLARSLEIDPAEALNGAAQRFSERFAIVKNEAAKSGRDMKTCSLDELDALWEHAKKHAQQRSRKSS